MTSEEIKSQIKEIREQIDGLKIKIQLCELAIKGVQLRCKHPDKFPSYSMGDYNGIYCPDCESYPK